MTSPSPHISSLQRPQPDVSDMPTITTSDLGRLEDLPADYVGTLQQHNLAPLWPALRTFIPQHRPTRRTQPYVWRYAEVRPLLMRAGELTPIEKAERRVLVLCNPGHGLQELRASPRG